ncbi:MAG: M20 family peptidase [Alphaproteobacteria bacterium]|nr:M20 family peptidase [Alphaproteobacteria bacterium]
MDGPLAYAADLDAALPEMLALIERVVNIDSGSYCATGVNAVQDAFGAALGRLGFTVERQALAARGDQLTATLNLGNGPRILILGHADTVWPAGTVAEWPFRRHGDRLAGPGVGDMKANVVLAIFALGSLLRRGLTGVGSIAMLIVPDEELGSPGSRTWIEDHAGRADICLTLEPARSGGGLVVGRGAIGSVLIEAQGVTAHCGVAPENGASAIRTLAELVGPLEALTDHGRGVGASVGILRGGAARQVVPDRAELHLDLRAPDAPAAEALFARVKALVAGPSHDPRVARRMTGGFGRPAFPTGAGTRALYALAAEIAAELDTPIAEIVSRGGSDGSFAANLGVPTLDGLGAICHDTCSRRETIELASLARRGALFAGLIAAIASGRPIPRA